MPTYEILDYGSPDGSQWGATSTDRIAFYGSTPVVKTLVTNITTTNEITNTTGGTALSTLIQQLKTYGLV